MIAAGTRPSRPALRYHGSKWLLAKWILRHFPEHECYVEPYGGAAGVLLQKQRSWLEIYNDADNQVVNFFRVLRENPADLVGTINLTPYARAEWELAVGDPDPEDAIERARRFYVRAYLNIAGATAQWNSGFRRQKVISKDGNGSKKMTPAAISFMKTEHLYTIADRLKGVQIECDDARAIIERYDSPETLHYCDPPYLSSTRGRWKDHAYACEMTDDDHRELARLLHTVEGMVVISGYRCELYDHFFGDWYRMDKQARVNGPGHATESLWLSPRTVEALAKPRQLKLQITE